MNRTWIVAFGDTAAFWIVFFLLLTLRLGGFSAAAVQAHLLPFAILFLSWILVFFLFGLYDILLIKPTISHLKRFGLALSLCLGIGVLLFYFAPIFGIAPKTNLIFQTAGFGILSFLWRRRVFLTLASKMAEPAVLVGTTRYSTELKATIERNPQLGLELVLHTDNAHDAVRTMRERAGGVFITEESHASLTTEEITALYRNNTQIIDIAAAYERFLDKIPVEYVSQSWITENIDPRRNPVSSAIVHAVDACLAIAALVITSPLWIATAIAIYLDDKGPVLYTQERTGLYGKPFKLFKFRSMIIDSEKEGAAWAAAQDSRVTPVGKVLRKLHLDELPQMINIIRGDIALVGPRPERPEFVAELEQAIPHYGLRHVIRPGFTGWAQIKYRYARTLADSKEKFEYDLYYIKNKNIFLDFGIIIRTLQIIFTH